MPAYIAHRAWIGVDPGLTGALALYAPGLEELVVEDMPRTVEGKIDHFRLADIIQSWTKAYSVQLAVVERVHSMPKQGVASSFTFGDAYGAVKQALASAGIPYQLVSPATWKAVYGLRGGRENKDLSRERATTLFPKFVDQWFRKRDDGRAESALLARYASNMKGMK